MKPQFYSIEDDTPAFPENFPLDWRLARQSLALGPVRQDVWVNPTWPHAQRIYAMVPVGVPLFTVKEFYPTGEERRVCFYDAKEAHDYYIRNIDLHPEIDYEEGTL